jgi:hypothetical protein
MALKKEFREQLVKAGFQKFEIAELNSAKTPDGKPQDLDKICNSHTFAEMLESRREWWRMILGPKSEGGKGMTYKQGQQALRNLHRTKKGKKHKISIWDWMKIAYKPKDKIQSKRAFTEAITKKSIITRALGTYGKQLKKNPINTSKCSVCRGTGNQQNLEGRNQLCVKCGGTGLSARKSNRGF